MKIAVVAKWIIIALVAFFGYKLVAVLIKSISNIGKTEDTTNAVIDNEVLVDTGTQTKLKAAANSIYAILQPWRTDEAALYDAFSDVTSEPEFQLLYGYFAVRDNRNLYEWIRKRLTVSEVATLNELLNGQGIEYQF